MKLDQHFDTNDDIIVDLALGTVDVQQTLQLESEAEVTLNPESAKQPLLSRIGKSIARKSSFRRFDPAYRSAANRALEETRSTAPSPLRKQDLLNKTSRPKWLQAFRRASRKMVSLRDTDSGFYGNANAGRPSQDDLDLSQSIKVEILPLPRDANQDHHVKDKHGKSTGGFTNPWPSWQSAGLTDIYSAFTKGAALKYPPKPGEEETFEENGRLVKVLKPDWQGEERQMHKTELGVTAVLGARVCWLGHASVLVQLPRRRLADKGEEEQVTDEHLLDEAQDEDEKVGIIFDPIFSKRCSPSQWAGPARYLNPPCSVAELPPIQICCISHDHYDHLDYNTIMDLWRVNDERIHFFVALGVKAWFLSCGIPECNIHEMDWHQEALVTLASEHTSHRKYRDDPSGYPPLRSRQQENKVKRSSMPGGFFDSDEDDSATLEVESSPYGNESGSSSQEHVTLLDSSEARASRPHPPSTIKYAPLTLKVVCTPAQHRSGRGVLDQMKTLWASWVVGVVNDEADGSSSKQGFRKQDDFKVFFGGDTGYRYAGVDEKDRNRFICPAFEDIAHRYGPMDLCLLPISTGSSLSFLRNLIGLSLHHYSLTSAQHSNAWDAIQIAKLMGARRTVAIHHSTFSPEDESRGCVYEFVNIAREEDVSQNWQEEGCFVVADIGEVLEVV